MKLDLFRCNYSIVQRDSIDLDACSKVDSTPAIHLVVLLVSQILPHPSPTLLSAVTTVVRDGPASCCILLAPSPDPRS